ncbi:MAG TPA: HIT domain-containing protein [Pedococcus sp.]|nr:HIT domain-containing protein [Pedococcus sp.]
MSDCIFCRIHAGDSPARFVERTPTINIFHPIGPQVPGHVLVVPTWHVTDAAESPTATAEAMRAAAQYAQDLGRPANIITSIGAEATQSVFHLHVHVLPRGQGDGLRVSWPWVRAK